MNRCPGLIEKGRNILCRLPTRCNAINTHYLMRYLDSKKTGLCHKETFANGSFLGINMVVFDEEHEVFSSLYFEQKKDRCLGGPNCSQIVIVTINSLAY